ncbi:MAG: YHYH protein [Pseudomonadales bacterium]|nr:YHYH protein [Pseudomonadales bacterium]
MSKHVQSGMLKGVAGLCSVFCVVSLKAAEIDGNNAFLSSDERYSVISDSNIYGARGLETVLVSGSPHLQIDGNVERVELPGSLAEYQFSIAGTRIQVSSDNRGSLDFLGLNQPTTLSFADGSATLTLTALGFAAFGGVSLPVSPASMQVALDTTDKSSTADTHSETSFSVYSDLITSTFSAARFPASTMPPKDARPYVHVQFIDYDDDGVMDASLLQSNGIPSTYDYDHTTSNNANISNICFDDPSNGPESAGGACYQVEANARAFVIPLKPVLTTTATPIGTGDHSGMAISGATFETPVAPVQQSEGYAVLNAYPEGWEVLDDCNGHAGTGGAPYHYHGDPTYPDTDGQHSHTQRATGANNCLPEYTLTVSESSGHGNLIGFMADGFPIYGTDGYANSTLDACNGHTTATPEFTDGIYHYHALSADAVSAAGGTLAPLPECLMGKLWHLPHYPEPERMAGTGLEGTTSATVASSATLVDAVTVADWFSSARFGAEINPDVLARPFVHVAFIDWQHDGIVDASLLQSNGVPSTYDYDYTTRDNTNTPDICFDDPNNGPAEEGGACYPIEANVRAFIVPLNPEISSNGSRTLNPDDHSGIAISGATFETPTAPVQFSAGYAVTNDYPTGWEVLDDCNGHSGFEGAPYHYHGDPTYPVNDGLHTHTLEANSAADCLPDYALQVDSATGHAAPIGMMADGFPIYGTDGYDRASLDDCNGHTSATAEFPGGIYHYHALKVEVVTSNPGPKEIPPLPECLGGAVFNVPNYQSPELTD